MIMVPFTLAELQMTAGVVTAGGKSPASGARGMAEAVFILEKLEGARLRAEAPDTKAPVPSEQAEPAKAA